jgi:hypothetical protein
VRSCSRASSSAWCLRVCGAVNDLTDEIPAAVQIAVPKPSRPPNITFPPTRIFRFDAEAFELGLSSVEAAPGELIRIYDPARTVVDLSRLLLCAGTSGAVTLSPQRCSGSLLR